jgi:hypothetical protein
MDGLDPLLPKSNGHNPLVATLLAFTILLVVVERVKEN